MIKKQLKKLIKKKEKIVLQYTPLADVDEKLDIMEHVNQDHAEEVQVIAQYKFPDMTIDCAKIADIFEEGILVDINIDTQPEQVFAPFELDGDLEEQILYLAYVAMSKQGKSFSGNKKQYFTVTGKQQLTPHFTRLTLESKEAFPQNYAGYYYGMMLKTLAQPNKSTQPKQVQVAIATAKTVAQFIQSKTEKQQGKLMGVANQGLLLALKKMSSEQRQKVVKGMNKHIRIYTLRSAWQADGADFCNTGYMDIFTHESAEGKSAGTQWTESLKVGDVVMSRSQGEDNSPHLASGTQVLIADETAYPAVAGILELWNNPVLPTVILLSVNQAEQSYFSDEYLVKTAKSIAQKALQNQEEGADSDITDTTAQITVHRIVGNYQTQKTEVLALLTAMEEIDGAWAGTEYSVAKPIRHYLRNERKIKGRSNAVKGYWRL